MQAYQYTGYKYLRFTDFANLKFWDYYSLSNKNILEANYPIVKLKEVMQQRKGFISIDDSQIYKRCRVQISGKGVVLRDKIIGKEIKTKKQQLCKTNDFLVAEIDAKVGGYGIVPEELENAIVSGHYFLFEIDQSKLLPQFLGLIIKLGQFSKQIKATGSTNYAAIRPQHVLEYQIPLPDLRIQKILFEIYNKNICKAEEKIQLAANSEEEIENFFNEKLGLQRIQLKQKIKGLQFVEFQDLERWDVFSTDNRILKELRKAKYELKTLGSVYHFIHRGWNIKLYKGETFNYIEIGAVDPMGGIKEIKTLPTHKAPSRASQFVKEGDFIIGTTRPYLKKFALVEAKHNDYVCSSGFSVIEKSKEYNLSFLKQFLMSSYGIDQLKNKMTGALYPAITEPELRKIKVPFPKVEIQNEIMKAVELKNLKISNSREEAAKMTIEALEKFEKSLFKI